MFVCYKHSLLHFATNKSELLLKPCPFFQHLRHNQWLITNLRGFDLNVEHRSYRWLLSPGNYNGLLLQTSVLNRYFFNYFSICNSHGQRNFEWEDEKYFWTTSGRKLKSIVSKNYGLRLLYLYKQYRNIS